MADSQISSIIKRLLNKNGWKLLVTSKTQTGKNTLVFGTCLFSTLSVFGENEPIIYPLRMLSGALPICKTRQTLWTCSENVSFRTSEHSKCQIDWIQRRVLQHEQNRSITGACSSGTFLYWQRVKPGISTMSAPDESRAPVLLNAPLICHNCHFWTQ